MHFVLDQGSWHDTKALAVAFSGVLAIHAIIGFLLQIHMPYLCLRLSPMAPINVT